MCITHGWIRFFYPPPRCSNGGIVRKLKMKRSRGDGFRFEIFIVFPNELTISLFVTNVVDNKKKVKSFLILFRLILKADAVPKIFHNL